MYPPKYDIGLRVYVNDARAHAIIVGENPEDKDEVLIQYTYKKPGVHPYPKHRLMPLAPSEPVVYDKGQKVRILKGARTVSMLGSRREGVAKKSYVVTVASYQHEIDDSHGFIPAKVEWAGEGAYWKWTEDLHLTELVQE